MDVAAKLQLKGSPIRVVNTPKDVGLSLPAAPSSPAVLVFVRTAAELTRHKKAAVEAAKRDDPAWIAYPKAGKLGTDLNRDSLWKLLDGDGIRPVRQVSLDDTWSAVRFRPGRTNLKT